jgi:molybdenum cofactor cytidylyltransferase
MGRSLACGVAAAREADGFVVALADMPWVRASTIDAVAQALRDGAPVAVAVVGERRGHPVGFAASYAAALLALDGDRGARDLVASAGTALCEVEVDDDGAVRDVDVPDDLAR